MGAFEGFTSQRAVLLTTYRRDGTPVSTVVNIVVADGRAFFRTYDQSGKAKRLRHNPQVEVAPSTFDGKPMGPSMRANACRVEGDAATTSARLLAR